MVEWVQPTLMVAAFIWGAAKITIGLQNLTERLDRFEKTVERVSFVVATTLADHGERIGRIEGKLDA